ncbi:MAG: YihY/virulence factor BrkB family protein [Actinomycetia bacterium]|nr:YihY/virulence factor BrkB family protein [Actinomycetes bacterium]
MVGSRAVTWFKDLRRAADQYQRRHKWLALPYAVVKKFGDDQGGRLAALISYYGFFSIFPLMLALVSILGFVLQGNPHLQQEVLNSTLSQFPVIGDELRHTGKLSGSGVGLAVGLVGLLWAGLGAIQATETAMNDVWEVPLKARPNFFKSKLRALAMLPVLGLGIVAVTIIGSAATFSDNIGPIGAVVGIALSFATSTGLFMVAFKLMTHRHLSWRMVLPGAVVGAAGWVALQLVGGWYVGHEVQGASQTYGTFAVVIALLAWLYLLGQLVVLAAEVNVVVACGLWPRSLSGEDLTDADLAGREFRPAGSGL